MNSSRITTGGRRMKIVWDGFMTFAMAILFSATAFAQAPAAPGAAAASLSAEQLTTLVGRIALYPDDLVAIILPAATSPLQIVQADRYLDKRKADPKLPLDDRWDDPVKSLLNYPDVVKMMSTDLDWTSDLGEAVVQDQAAVLEAVQIFRRQAQAAGNLKSDSKQVVKTEKEVVIIEPADPQVVYVPQYNPSTVVVYGAAPAWGYYPTPYPSYYYPYAPGAAMAAGVIWGAAIGAAWSGNHYGWGGGNDINVNRNTNVNVGSGNTVNRGDRGGQGGSSSWKSNKQPGQVSSSVGKNAPSNRAGDARGSGGRGGAGGVGSAGGAGGFGAGGAGGFGGAGGGAGGARPSTQPAGGGYRGGDSAMGGYNSGRQTSMDSSRGASSRSSMSGGGASRSAASAGASRGGGAARGGGGGRGGGRR